MISCITTTDPTPGSVSPFIQAAGNMLHASLSEKAGFIQGSFRLLIFYFKLFMDGYESIVRLLSMRENTRSAKDVRDMPNPYTRPGHEINDKVLIPFKVPVTRPTGTHIAEYINTRSDSRIGFSVPGNYFTV
jgi:hypothetical protein